MDRLEVIIHDIDYLSDYEANERQRQANENVRIANENERIENEEERINQEDSRKQAEIEREKKIFDELTELDELEQDMKKRLTEGDLRGEKGEKGDRGEKGDPGIPGKDGTTPVRGVDYWTEDDVQTIKEDCHNYVDELIGSPLDIINGEVV